MANENHTHLVIRAARKRRQAMLCRDLIAGISKTEVIDMLEELAGEFDAVAGRLEAEARGTYPRTYSMSALKRAG